MDNSGNNDEETRFFDAQEHIEQEPDFVSDCPLIRSWEYDVWISAPESVSERRRKFNRWMEITVGEFGGENRDISRMMEDGGAVLRTSISIEDEFSSSRSSMSSWNTDDSNSPRGVDSSECGNCSRGGEFDADEIAGNEVDMNRPRTKKNLKKWWLSKLHSLSCLTSKNVIDDNLGSVCLTQAQGRRRVRRVRVRRNRNRSKELSALFTGQDIQAHDGSISVMKFSNDGRYLASAGEDKVVRVWQITEDERSDTTDIPVSDSSCVYFSMNRLSDLGPLMVEKEKNSKFKSLRRTQDSACVIFPPKVFRIIEKPLHVFRGHVDEIMDLSWSKNNCLLSSSVDKTVRLWRVGVDRCLKVFQHSDYVTCIQFNPVNDDYFISGSIDGKVRIWATDCCKVVDWTETKDIITAVSYRPDGQGGIIGSVNGTCRFFDLSDHQFELGAKMCLTGKKKSPCKRITGFQFLPQDPSKILVNCADSKVRIIDGTNVVGKYKAFSGLRNGGNQISASFTSDGKHIVSASEDSNVYIWKYADQEDSSFLQPKAVKSFECFSSDASVAIPWPGIKASGPHESSNKPLPFSLSTSLSLSQDYFLDSITKGSSSAYATWPEEKLPISSSLMSGISKSQYRFFKNSCQSSSDSHAWGLVIVTSGWDGRIRSFHNYGLPVSP
ncbi:hypothetical protein ABFS82_06G099200 [Erythranthe guttata]|uniref:WD repeat-containing protein 44 isoform X1 n=1 Tax=Erythranthe guttata TaxID=4155 RepID=UPI00064DDE47|nr:PREDICTED: WD repeat-containing protein 44 isoform X1 [Erythranthe guttata]|eukprot:XP_012858391.1 PREDICTED: WD repeat-containing protein 44 isoform X1 [Erythranthe guttata]